MKRAEVIEATIGVSEVEERRRRKHRPERHHRDEDQTDDGESGAGDRPDSFWGDLLGMRGAIPAGPMYGRNGLL